jgi:hypothetical protein
MSASACPVAQCSGWACPARRPSGSTTRTSGSITATASWRSSSRRNTGGTLDGIELFEDAADEVVAKIARRYNLDPSVYCPGRHTYYFPDLNMILWRGIVADEDGEQGYVFDSVSLHVPGYYDAKTLAYVRERSGLPPLPDTKG